MQISPLPEVGVAGLLFLMTLSMSYIIWRVLFGKRFPVKEKKEKTEKAPTLSLNEIMGYEFIQIKNFNQSSDTVSPAPSSSVTEDTPGLYATGSDDADGLEDEGDEEGYADEGPSEDDVNTFNVSEDDLEEICAWCDEEGSTEEELKRLAQAYNNFLSHQETAETGDGYVPSEHDMEHEAEMDKYREELYDRYMDSCATDESDRAALLELGNLISRQDGENADDVDPNDLPDIS